MCIYFLPFILYPMLCTLLCCEAGQFQSVQQSAISPTSCSFTYGVLLPHFNCLVYSLVFFVLHVCLSLCMCVRARACTHFPWRDCVKANVFFTCLRGVQLNLFNHKPNLYLDPTCLSKKSNFITQKAKTCVWDLWWWNDAHFSCQQVVPSNPSVLLFTHHGHIFIVVQYWFTPQTKLQLLPSPQ